MQLFGKYREKDGNDSKAHEGVSDDTDFFVEEHGEYGVLKLAVLVVGLVLFLAVVSALLLEEGVVNNFWVNFMLVNGVLGGSF